MGCADEQSVCFRQFGSFANRQYSPRFLFMWPNAKICVMGPDQLSSVMQTVSGKNKPVVEGEDRWKDLRTKIEAQSEATYSTARIWVRKSLKS